MNGKSLAQGPLVGRLMEGEDMFEVRLNKQRGEAVRGLAKVETKAVETLA